MIGAVLPTARNGFSIASLPVAHRRHDWNQNVRKEIFPLLNWKARRSLDSPFRNGD